MAVDERLQVILENLQLRREESKRERKLYTDGGRGRAKEPRDDGEIAANRHKESPVVI